MKEQHWFTPIHDSCATLRIIRDRIDNLSVSFFVTGNETMANKLDNIASIIDECQSSIDKAVGNGLDEQVKQAWQSSINSLNAALAGVEIAQKGVK